MSLEYIRKTYRVPAKRGMPVCYTAGHGEVMFGKITGSYGAYLRIRFDGQRRPLRCHPTWQMEYPSVGKKVVAMADVTGPISTLPGASHAVPEGTMCDEHPDRPAVARIQGETDSMGCEMIDACAECVVEIRNEGLGQTVCTGDCDWCKKEATDLRPARRWSLKSTRKRMRCVEPSNHDLRSILAAG